MPRPKAGDRVLGPYREKVKDGVRFKVISVVEETNRYHLFPKLGAAVTEAQIAAAEKAAQKYAEEARAALQGVQRLTLDEAIESFMEHVAEGRKDRTLRMIRDRLRSYFEPDLDRPVSSLLRPPCEVSEGKEPEASRAAELYRLLRARPRKAKRAAALTAEQAAQVRTWLQEEKLSVSAAHRRARAAGWDVSYWPIHQLAQGRAAKDQSRPLAAGYHRHCLKDARRACAFFVQRRWLTMNPLKEVKGVGKINKGKPQHRLTEARRFFQVAIHLAEHGRPDQQQGATAVLTVLLLGLRQSELTLRQVRDLDRLRRDGRELLVLVIDEGKTKNSKGTVEIPQEIAPYLLRQAQGKAPTDLLFPGEVKGQPFNEGWVRSWTLRICELAEVPLVCAHALRGGFASIGVTTGALPHIIAQALRQGDEGQVAKEHYIEPGALQQAQRARVADLLLDRPADDRLQHVQALIDRWEEQGGDFAARAAELRAVLEAGESFPKSSLGPSLASQTRVIRGGFDSACTPPACTHPSEKGCNSLPCPTGERNPKPRKPKAA